MPIYRLGDRVPQLPASDRFWAAPDAQIIGDVRLGEDVGIWFGAILRGDNDPIIMVHTDPGMGVSIGEGCTIGHHAIIHGCTIGSNALIGMGATILNGARIGNNCLVGANALVTEGKTFPDNSLIVGSPARVVRTLDETAIAGLRLSADKYVRNWQRFARDLQPL
jgi:carbonic anhydrase/acetyltransferase-like protein (isoleucine patch superfamily)